MNGCGWTSTEELQPAQPHNFDDAERTVPEFQCLTNKRLGSGGFNFLRSFGSQAVFAIVGYRPINDRSAIDALPSIKHQKEIREAL